MVPEPENSGPSLLWIAGLLGTVIAGLGFVFAAKQRATSEQLGTPVANAKRAPIAKEELANVEPVKEPVKVELAKEPVKKELVQVKQALAFQKAPPPNAPVADLLSPAVRNVPKAAEAEKEEAPLGNSPTRGPVVTGLGVVGDTWPADWQSLRGALQQAMPNIQTDLIVPPPELQQVQQAMQSLAPDLSLQALTPDLSLGLDWFSDKKPEAAVVASAGKALGIIREAFTTGAEAAAEAFTTGAEAAAGAAAEAAAEASKVADSFKAPRARAKAGIDPML